MKAELKPEELRLKNLVTDEFYDTFKKVIVVESLNEKGINLEIENSDDYPEMQSHWIEPYYEYDKLRGIELSEEWLKKAGFEKSMGHYEKGFPLWVCIGGLTGATDIWIHGKYSPSVKIGYVHQLQNLYYALTGNELIFNHG